MPSVTDILRTRNRRRAVQRGLTGWTHAGALVAAVLSLLAGTVGLIGAYAYGEVRRGLPAVEDIELLFDPTQGGAYRATRFYDRTGRILLLEVTNPPLPGALPEHLGQAVVAFEDPSFWSNPGYDLKWILRAVGEGLRGRSIDSPNSITQRLARTTLLPPGEQHLPSWLQALREAVLAAELTAHYSKEQILTWYLSSAPFGHLAYGAEAGARRYLGKSVTSLSLSESALLAATAADPSLNPWNAPQQAKARQAEVLEAMATQGWIDQDEARTARAAPLQLQPAEQEAGLAIEAFARLARQRLGSLLGPGYADRGGLRVTTTLDYDLQLQTDCLAQTHIARMSGGDPGAIVPTSDGSACVAASLLIPLRPGDAGVDHRMSGAAVIALDPTTGEVLSWVVSSPRATQVSDIRGEAGSTLYPFYYLTAFASGYTPASMVLDVATTFAEGESGHAYAPEDDDGVFHGPVRMRTALANAYPMPALRTLRQVGVEAVQRTARQMGLTTLDEPSGPTDLMWMAEHAQADLVELTYAYGVMANGGAMAGVRAEGSDASVGGRNPDPAVILRVQDAADRVVYAFEPGERAVLSPQLAYLMVNVLSDEAARWVSLGRSNPLEVGRPAGAMIGVTADHRDNWTIGFVPSLAVGVWVGNTEGGSLQGVGLANGAAPLWNAVLRYAARDLPRAGWGMPPGMSQVDVCDPSGMLPTEYCPTIVQEIFIQGTEPTHYDTLYQPFRVNRETGKLATLFTPLSLVEERVYLIPPPEASEWALQAGIDRPPQEYDTLYAAPVSAEVNITAPEPFALVRGEVEILGSARPEGFEYFRLQYGQGLNPDRWVQIGEDVRRAVRAGRLDLWDTDGLNGLYTLQLLVVLEDGRVSTAAVQVTVDNEPPVVHLLLPEQEQVFTWPNDEQVVLQADVSDDVAIGRVEFYVDNRGVATISTPPYSTRCPIGGEGAHVAFARVYDAAGNRAESERVRFWVTR